MKKCCFSIAALSLSALVFFSCKKDEKPVVTGDVMTFTGRIGNGGSKTEINGFEMTWSEGDQVRINGKVFDSELTSDHKTATFTGEYMMPPYEAYYPAGLYKDGEYVLPDTQHYAGVNGKVLSGVSPMYAESSSADLTFHNICAMIRLDVTGEGTVKAVKVISDAPLSGEFEIKGNADDGFYAQLKSASSKAAHDTLTLDCGVGVTLSKTAATTFYVAVPQGQCDSLKFTMVGDNGLTCSFAAGSPVLAAGTLYAKELADVKFVKPEILSGVFSVSANKRVQFSRGNLYCTRGGSAKAYTYSFAFEDEQYDCRSINDGSLIGAYYKDGVKNDVTPLNTSGLFQWLVYKVDDDYGAFTEVVAILGYAIDVMDWGPAMGDGWRTLTGGNSGEWKYLFDGRATTSGIRYAKAIVNNVPGIILVPDDWNTATHDLKSTNTSTAAYIDNEIDADTWNNTLEPKGCVFLPAAGSRIQKDFEFPPAVSCVGTDGYYWSSLAVSADYAFGLHFYSSVNPTYDNHRKLGASVRLVQEIK